jgi:ABC-type amino acid transport substrate-binding protein
MKKSVVFGALTVAGLAAGAAAAGTLDDVKARGKLNCGVTTGLVGFAAPDATANGWGSTLVSVVLLPQPYWATRKRLSLFRPPVRPASPRWLPARSTCWLATPLGPSPATLT